MSSSSLLLLCFHKYKTMEAASCLLYFLLLLLTVVLFSMAATIITKKSKHKEEEGSRALPPGPPALLFLAKFLWLRKSIFDVDQLLRQLRARYGPLITLRLGFRPLIFITDRSLAHHALVHMGAVFADRPPPFEADKIVFTNRCSINSAPYGPRWRALRRNLAAEILHPSRIKLFAPARRRALDILLDRLRAQTGAGDGAVAVMASFQHAMFCLMALMCFGEQLGEEAFRDIEASQMGIVVALHNLDVFAFLPNLITKLVFRRRWNGLVAARRREDDIFLPLVRAWARRERQEKQRGSIAYSYMDSLLDLRLPGAAEEGERRLSEDEMVSLCSEFLNASTETTKTALQWIMANIVKRPDIQERLFREVEAEAKGEESIEEEELQRMPYLRAVVLEALRRHPPVHFLLPHAATEEVRLGGYVIPAGAVVNVAVAEVGWDEGAWAEPMEFRPERFLAGGEGEHVDVAGDGGAGETMRMMPFGAGRRACPGYALALLHLEVFVSGLVREFEWRTVEGEEVDLEEKLEFTSLMKTPLRAVIVPRALARTDMDINAHVSLASFA